MVAPGMFQNLLGGRALREYRQSLRDAFALTSIETLVPTLLHAPFVEAVAGNVNRLLQARCTLLQGGPGAGRSLIFYRILHDFANEASNIPAFYLSLAAIDDTTRQPALIFAEELTAISSLAPLPGSNRRGAVLVLVDDWEMLSPVRRGVWRAYLGDLIAEWPSGNLVIAVPPGEEWPNSESLNLALSAAAADELLGHLHPGQDLGELRELLAPGQPLAPLGDSPAGVAALALVAAEKVPPTTPRALLAAVEQIAGPLLTAPNRIEQFSTPIVPLPGATIWELYQAARGAAIIADASALDDLPSPHRPAALALMAAHRDDPAPALASLIGGEAPDLERIARAATIISARPAAAPQWTLRLLELIAVPERQQLRQQLRQLLPALAIGAAKADQVRVMQLLASHFAADPSLLIALIDAIDAPDRLRWDAADLLASRRPNPDLVLNQPATDDLSAAARAYVLALSSDASRLILLEPPAREWLSALASSTSEGAHRAAAANSLLAMPQPGLQAQAIRLSPDGGADRHALLARACVAAAPILRGAALVAVIGLDIDERLKILSRALERDDADIDACLTVLNALATIPGNQSVAALTRLILRASAPLVLRCHAVMLLAPRRADITPLLLRMLRVPQQPIALRVSLVEALSQRGSEALEAIAAIALTTMPAPVRYSACRALGALGATPGNGDQAAATLVRCIQRAGADHLMIQICLTALGRLGSAVPVATIGALLEHGAHDAISSGWQSALGDLGEAVPPSDYAQQSLAEPLRQSLYAIFAEAQTSADLPASWEALIARQTDSVRIAAAEALAGAARDPESGAVALLIATLRNAPSTAVARTVIGVLASAGEVAARELERLALNPSADPSTRWMAAEVAGQASGFVERIERLARNGQLDPFVSELLLRRYAEQAGSQAVPLLRSLFDNQEQAELRPAIIAALGASSAPSAAQTLARIAADPSTAAQLRAAAVMAIPADAAPVTLQPLRELLQGERQPAALTLALLRAPGLRGDRSLLSRFLSYAQSERIEEALAAIGQLATIADPNVAPRLTQIVHQPTVALELRLAAADALLARQGYEQLALLRPFLHAEAPTVRLRALTSLISAQPDHPQIVTMLEDERAPLAIRLCAAEAVAIHRPETPALREQLTNPEAPLQLRLIAINALRSARPDEVADLLLPIATDPAAPPTILRRSIRILAERTDDRQGIAALLALATIASIPEITEEAVSAFVTRIRQVR